MRKLLTPENIISAAYIVAETVIYIIFNVMAAAGLPDPIYLKYSGVLLCAAVSFVWIYFCGLDGVILACAFCFTAVSDLFLLVLGINFEVGLITFIITQSIYLFRLYRGRCKKIWITLAVRFVCAAVLISALAAMGMLDFLVAECAVYVVMLAANIVDAFIICKKNPNCLIFAVGLALFLCCDICVGLYNFGSTLGISLPTALYNFVAVGMWAFYLPSQTLICLSVRRGGLNAQDNKEDNREGKDA